MINRARVLAELRHSEGCRLEAYLDSEGVWTIGYGSIRYACDDTIGTRDARETRRVSRGDPVRGGDRITQEQADAELDVDLNAACTELDRALPWVEYLPVSALETLTRMAFQLGVPRLLEFRRRLAALRRHDFAGAVLEGFDSQWARQTPRRAVRVLRGFVVASHALH